MAFPYTTIVELVLFLAWRVLVAPGWKSSVFQQIFTSKSVLEELFVSAGISFCPGLFEILQADAPPTVEFFKRLPTSFNKRWGIYALVFEKPSGGIPLVYIGSGTNSFQGVFARIRQYEMFFWENRRGQLDLMPLRLRTLKEKGYKLTHRGLLSWSDMPPAGEVPMRRLLFLVLETMFAYFFWAVHTNTRGYQLDDCRGWELSDYAYRGLCTHSPLTEFVPGEFNLSADELEQIRQDIVAKNRAYHRANYQRRKVQEPDKLKAEWARSGEKRKLLPHEVQLARGRKQDKKYKDSKRAYCDVCHTSFTKQRELVRHVNGDRHKKKVADLANGNLMHSYDVCQFRTHTAKLLRSHNKGQRHKDRVAALAIQATTFTTVADNQQTVQFPVYQGERVNCEDNTSLGEFTLAPIPPMRAGEAVLEVVFEVDVNGILKVTATEKTSGRSANITISNSVGKLSSSEIENMINDAEKFKTNDEAFSKRFEAKQQLESYIGRVEEIISDPTLSLKLKRGQKDKIEQQVSEAMAALEITDSGADELKKQELALKRLVTKAMSSR